jgi:hypothetical protein
VVEALRPRVIFCVGERVGCPGDLLESDGLVSLVCRDVVRLLGEVGGLFASRSEPCLAPFVLTSLALLERRRPLPSGEWARDSSLMARSRASSSSSVRSVLIIFFSGESTTVSASESLWASSWSWSPLRDSGRFSLDDGEAALDGFSRGGVVWGRSSRAAAGSGDAFNTGSPLLVITHVGGQDAGVPASCWLRWRKGRQGGGRSWALRRQARQLKWAMCVLGAAAMPVGAAAGRGWVVDRWAEGVL